MSRNSEIIKVEPETLVLEDSTFIHEAKLTITNLKHWPICYKIKSTAVDKATAKPAFGRIAGFASERITIKAKKFAFDMKERRQETLLIKVASMPEDNNISRLSTSVMKHAFSGVNTTETKIALIFQPSKHSSRPSDKRIFSESTIENRLNQIETRNSLRNQTQRNISMYGDCVDGSQTHLKRNSKTYEPNAIRNEISEDSCLGTASDPCHKKINSEQSPQKSFKNDYKTKQYFKNDKTGLSGVESASDSDTSISPKEKYQSSSDEKEANIKLWANSAGMNNNMKSLEKSLLKVEKEIRDTDESVILLSEKVHAKSKLITTVQKKVLEQNMETDSQIAKLSERVEKLDLAVNALQKPMEQQCKPKEQLSSVPVNEIHQQSVSTGDTNMMTKAIICSSAIIISAFCVSKYIRE